MSDADALLAAVLDRPDDDTPRLVYADWLDEYAGMVPCPGCSVCAGPDERRVSKPLCGGRGWVSDGRAERAEFIRVQVELARLVCRPLAEVMFHPRVGTGRMSEQAVAGVLGGDPTGVEPGATVDWLATTVFPEGARWFGVGVVDHVGQDRHGLTVRLRPIPEDGHGGQNRPARDAARRKRSELRVRAKALFDGFGLQAERAAVFGVPPEWYLADEFDPTPNPGGLWPVAGVVRRGFVDEARLNLRTLVGGECPRCGGMGHRPYDSPEPQCRECSGFGTLPGVAAALGRLPLTRVVLTDREPNDYGPPADDCRFGWLPRDPRIDPGPAVLPPGLYQALADNDKGDGILRWPTRDFALAALSAACLAFARDRAAVPAA